jgi:sulfur relay protein TusB/DsrH
MLFLIASAPDTKEFKTAYKLARDIEADVCLVQNAVYASKTLEDSNIYVLRDDLRLRGVSEKEAMGRFIDYNQLVDLMIESDKVIGVF